MATPKEDLARCSSSCLSCINNCLWGLFFSFLSFLHILIVAVIQYIMHTGFCMRATGLCGRMCRSGARLLWRGQDYFPKFNWLPPTPKQEHFSFESSPLKWISPARPGSVRAPGQELMAGPGGAEAAGDCTGGVRDGVKVLINWAINSQPASYLS